MNGPCHAAGEQAHSDLARRVIGSFDVERSCKIDPGVGKWWRFIDPEEWQQRGVRSVIWPSLKSLANSTPSQDLSDEASSLDNPKLRP